MLRRAAGWLLGLVARAWLATLHIVVVRDAALDPDDARPWVLAFWHGQQLPLLGWRRRRRSVALVSLSRDGELLAAALPRLGMAVERGSSSRSGARGLRAAVRRLRAGLDAAFAVDGPRGPRGTVHPGALTAARLAGGVVVPMGVASRGGWVLSTWDRFELPRPFGRVVVALGAPLSATTAQARVRDAIEAARAAATAAL